MAPDDSPDGPSIAPPSLGFGFRRKKKPDPPQVEPDPPLVEPDPPLVEPDPPLVEQRAPASVVETPAAPAPTPRQPRAQRPRTIFDEEPTEILPSLVADPVDTTPTVTFTPSPTPARSDPTPAKPAREPREPREITVPTWVAGRSAAVVTGVIVGLFVVGATAAALRLCEALQGTSSCGGAGFFLLVAILLLGVLLGSALLRLTKVPDPGSTSFLAVGLMAVLALLLLVGSLFSWWMVIVIPLVCAATFTLSHWVTTTFVDDADT